MRATITLGDVVGEAQHGLVEAVVPGERKFHPDAERVVGGAQVDGRGEYCGLAAIQPLDEGHETAVVAHRSLDRGGVAFVAQHDGEAGVQECQLAQAALQEGKIELDVGEGCGAGLEGDLGAAAVVGMADDGEGGLGITVAETDHVFGALAPDAHLHPFGERVDHRGADAVQAARDLVGILVEFTAGVEAGEDDLGGGDTFLGVDIGGNAAAVVTHCDGAVAVQHEFAIVGEPGLRLVDGVVDDLEGHVMQA